MDLLHTLFIVAVLGESVPPVLLHGPVALVVAEHLLQEAHLVEGVEDVIHSLLDVPALLRGQLLGLEARTHNLPMGLQNVRTHVGVDLHDLVQNRSY